MQLPSFLLPWWTFWAGLTALINWEAFGAIGTVGALVAGVHALRQPAQQRMDRDRALLGALMAVVASAEELLQMELKNIEAGAVHPEGFSPFARISEAIRSFPVADLPAKGAMDNVLWLPVVLEGLDSKLAAASSGNVMAMESAKSSATALAGARDTLGPILHSYGLTTADK